MSVLSHGKTCSRRLSRLLAQHEERWVRVLQLGRRVTLLVDVGPVGATTTCVVCGRKVLRIYNSCSAGHYIVSEPYCRNHHPSPIAEGIRGGGPEDAGQEPVTETGAGESDRVARSTEPTEERP